MSFYCTNIHGNTISFDVQGYGLYEALILLSANLANISYNNKFNSKSRLKLSIEMNLRKDCLRQFSVGEKYNVHFNSYGYPVVICHETDYFPRYFYTQKRHEYQKSITCGNYFGDNLERQSVVSDAPIHKASNDIEVRSVWSNADDIEHKSYKSYESYEGGNQYNTCNECNEYNSDDEYNVGDELVEA